MDIKEIAERYTREEWLKLSMKIKKELLIDKGNCPNGSGLKTFHCCTDSNITICDETCIECWKQAIKDIKFKDDLEGENMKKLNIIEAMKMPVGTEFKVIFNGEHIENNTMIIYSDGEKNKHIDWKCYPKDSFIKPYDFLINGIFIPISKPVEVIEAIKYLEEGKIIKSYKGYEYKKEDGKIKCVSEILPYQYIDFEELEGQWSVLYTKS